MSHEFQYDSEHMLLADALAYNLPIYLLCGDWKQYQSFVKDYPKIKGLVYIADAETLKGRTPGMIIRRGTWYGHIFIDQIEKQITAQHHEWLKAFENLDAHGKEGADEFYGSKENTSA